MLVNICLRWQSQAVRVPQPSASLRALCARSPQPSAQRDTLGRRAVWRPCWAAQGGPAPHPTSETAGQNARPPRAHPSVPHSLRRRPLAARFLWVLSMQLFPGGTPGFCLSYFGRKQKPEIKPWGRVCKSRPPEGVSPHCLHRQLPTGGAHIGSPGPRSPGGPLAGEAFSTAVGGCARYTPAEHLAPPSPESPALIRPLGRPSIHPPLLTEHPPVPDTAGWTHGE